MKTYKVTITEKLEMTVDAAAHSSVEAERLVEKLWNNGDYILDANHFKGVKFKADPPLKSRDSER
jgi:hypothetical protein